MRSASVLLLCLVGIACDDSMSPSPVNLNGTWSGQVGQPQSGTALRVTWTATQSGNTVFGEATLVKPTQNVPARGALTGTLNGTRLSLSYTALPGFVSGFHDCAISGVGSATVDLDSMNGTLALTFTECAGSGLEPTGSDQLTLTR